MQVTAKWDTRESRKSNGPGGTLDRQIYSPGDVFHCRRSAPHRACCGGSKARRMREYPSRGCPIYLSVEREGRIRAGTIAAHKDFAQMSGEVVGNRGTPPLLRRSRVRRYANRGGISGVP